MPRWPGRPHSFPGRPRGMPGHSLYVTTDSGPSQAFPATAAAFSSLTGATPTYIWLCDEASGNLADEVSAKAAVANNSPLYQQSTPFSGEVAVGFSNVANQRFATADTATSLSASSALLIVYSITADPVTSKTIASAFGDGIRMQTLSSSQMRCRVKGATAERIFTLTGTEFYDGSWNCLVVGRDATAGASKAICNQGTASAADSGDMLSDAFVALGSDAWTGAIAYAAFFTGASAELMLTSTGFDAFWTYS